MTKNINITSNPAPKASAKPQKYLFDGFSDLLIRMHYALEEEEWADDTCWDIACDQSVSEVEKAWCFVEQKAEDLIAVQPLSENDLILQRIAGLVKRAVSTDNIVTLCATHAKALECLSNASQGLAPAVRDLAEEAESCLDQMFEHALESEGTQDTILPLAA
ncbi:hypothetical protein PVV74_10860 [Roseovarius sp. SK2]|uniref:hypothetical protein n=1 Tax=Roseovarius TaxID=74030 RepID=UPI00237AC979|nr:hypothetical protein [Roseovarius sp. SK2]MDD9725955.1 hypothetical protein [Roseovarius sp. SK2]